MSRPLALPKALQACFDAANAGDEAGYLACLEPDAHFYGGITGIEHAGHPAILGAFRAGQDLLHRPTFEALQYYGDDQEGALKLRYTAARGQGASLTGIWHVRFAPGGRIEALALIWNPLAMLADPPQDAPLAISPEVQATLNAYFAAYNAGDDEAFLALLAPDISCWGSGTRILGSGILDVRSILKGSRDVFRIARIEPLAWYGKGLAVAVEARYHHAENPEKLPTVLLVYRLDEHLKIRHLRALWRPMDVLA